MDNHDLSNLPPSGHYENAGEYDPWLTDGQSRWAAFSSRSTNVSTPEQAELQHPLLTDEEQLSEQKALADFHISLLPNTPYPATFDEPEDPFALFAANRPLTYDDSQHPSDSEQDWSLGLLKGFTTEDLTDILPTELEGNDVLEPLMQSEQREQPEPSQGEYEKGIVAPESANPDTVLGKPSDKRSGKRRASEPRSSIKESIDLYFQESAPQSDRLTIKRQKPDSTETEFFVSPREIAARSQSAVMPEKSASPQKNTEQNPDKSLKERVKKETAKWVVRLEPGVERRYVCSYPNCGSTYRTLAHLKLHIFKHTGISVYKCTYPECINKPYFRTRIEFNRHVKVHHKSGKFQFCTICNKRFMYLVSYKEHMLNDHKADSEEHPPWLTDEENRRATFSRRSTTFSAPEQAELQQSLLTDEEQLSEQKTLVDFDISLLPNIPDRATSDEPEDPFALLAAYRPLTFDDDSQHSSVSELGLGPGLLEGFTTEDLTDLAAEDITDVTQAEPEWNDVLEPPDVVIKGIPKSSIEESLEAHFQKSLHKFARLSQKREETEMLPLSQATATSSQSAAIPKKVARSQKKTRNQNVDESLRKRVEEETNKWIVRCEGVEKQYMCSYPNCGFAYIRVSDLRKHIFGHTHISIFKCTYPECGDNQYFSDMTKLRRHEKSYHTLEKPYHCSLCGTRFGRTDNYKRHMLKKHKLTL